MHNLNSETVNLSLEDKNNFMDIPWVIEALGNLTRPSFFPLPSHFHTVDSLFGKAKFL